MSSSSKRFGHPLDDVDLTKDYMVNDWSSDQNNLFADLFAMAVLNLDLTTDPKRVVATLETIGKMIVKKFQKSYSMTELEAKLNQLRIRHKCFKYWRTIPGVIFDEPSYQATVTDLYWNTVVKGDEPPIFNYFWNNCCFLETRLHRIFEGLGVAKLPTQRTGSSAAPILISENPSPVNSTDGVLIGGASNGPIFISDDEVDLVAIKNQADLLYQGDKLIYYSCEASGSKIWPVDDRASLYIKRYHHSESDDELPPGYPEDALPDDYNPSSSGLVIPDTP